MKDNPPVSLEKEKATICIVNYKTLDFTRLCLRSIRKFTHCPYEVLVIDNDSKDQSLEYLRKLKWIRLIERDAGKDPINESGGYSHAAALDLGLANCNTEFFVAMHSDTFVIKDGWLSDLMGYFVEKENIKSEETRSRKADAQIASVGSGKVELEAKWRTILKNTTDFRTFMRKLFAKPDPYGKQRYYNRTICCLYRTEILKKENLSFLMDRDKGLTVGHKLYLELVDRGYKTVELPPSIMGRYIVHLAHATQVVNPQEFTLRGKTVRKVGRLARNVMSSPVIHGILQNDSLDS